MLWRRSCDAVAARVLCAVETRIRGVQQLVAAAAIPLRDPYAESHSQPGMDRGPGVQLDGAAQCLATHRRGGEIQARQDERELLAADARHEVDRPAVPQHDGCAAP